MPQKKIISKAMAGILPPVSSLFMSVVVSFFVFSLILFFTSFFTSLFFPLSSQEKKVAQKLKSPKKSLPFIDMERRIVGLDYSSHKGLSISTDDGSYSMNLRARIQSRFTQNVVPEKHSDDRTEFLIRRARLSLRGNTLNENWGYYIQLGFSKRDEESQNPNSLRDAVISYSRFTSFQISIGQMKIPFSRQRINSSGALQLVDRSLVSSELNLDRDVGITLSSGDFLNLNNLIGYSIGIFGGDGRNQTTNVPGILYSGRLFITPFGNAPYLSESDLEHRKIPSLTMGVAAGHNQNTNRARSTFGNTYKFARFDYSQAVADFIFKWQGFSIMGEYLWRQSNRSFLQNSLGEKEYSRPAHGYFVQTSYLFPFMLEGVFRYGELWPFAGADPALIYSREIGAGITYYIDYHDLKLHIDYFNNRGSFASAAHLSHEIRVQMQMFI